MSYSWISLSVVPPLQSKPFFLNNLKEQKPILGITLQESSAGRRAVHAFIPVYSLKLEQILTEWGIICPNYPSGQGLSKLALRDHAPQILEAIALDIETAQTELEQTEKSKGRGYRRVEDTAAETHSAQRLQEGFNQVKVVSEYRALRASFTRLWLATSPELDASAHYQLIRFNEAIDQAVSETTVRFMQQVESSRDFALAVLAHDLRNPLNATISSGQSLKRPARPDDATISIPRPYHPIALQRRSSMCC